MPDSNTMRPIPRYSQVKGSICSEIEDGKLTPHARVSSIKELCDAFAVSKITAQRALSDLVREGVLYRRPGVGTLCCGRGNPCHGN